MTLTYITYTIYLDLGFNTLKHFLYSLNLNTNASLPEAL
jgi:hypothetical protein